MEIQLEGLLGRRFGRTHKITARSPKEAVRALCQLVPGFREFMTSAHEHGIYFQMQTEHKDACTYDDFDFGCQKFILVPVISGSLFGDKGMMGVLIVVGLVLIALAIPGFVFTFGGASTLSAAIQTSMITTGLALITTGIVGLFTPGIVQDNKEEGSETEKAIYGGAAATAARGTPVPLLYGEFLATNMPVISSYIDDNEGNLLCAISEGDIEGIPEGRIGRDVYFNGLRSSSANVNDIHVTDGTQTNPVITNIKTAGFHIPVNSTLAATDEGTANPSVQRSFIQPYADIMKVRITRGPSYAKRQSVANESQSFRTKYFGYADELHSDYEYDNDFDPVVGALAYVLQVRNGDGDLIHVEEENFAYTVLKTKKEKIHTFDITDEPTPISVTLIRTDKGDPADPARFQGGGNSYSFQWVKGDITLVSIDTTWNERLLYPNTALLGVEFTTADFAQMPSVQGLFKGLIVPNVDSALNVSYAYSNNPAFILLDLLTNPRYGLGERVYTTTGPAPEERHTPGVRIEDIDLAAFYKASVYCQEQKITFNGYFTRSGDALDLIRSVAASFHGALLYIGGVVTVVLDQRLTTTDATQYRLYSESNTIQDVDDDGTINTPCFTYEGTARKSRTTAVEVSFIEPGLFYQESKEVVEDIASIQRYGYNQVSVKAIGCTDREQARRFGKYVLGSNLFNTETVVFRVGSEGALLIPGDICLIADPLKTQITSGGRIKEVSPNSITTDRAITGYVEGTDTFYLYTYGSTGIAQRNLVSDISGDFIETVSNFDLMPQAMQQWILVDESDENKFKRYRVQSVKEEDGQYEVIAVLYSDKKFDLIEAVAPSYDSVRRFPYSRSPAVNRSSIAFSLKDETS